MPRHEPVELAPLDRQIINALQGDFPVCERPYAEVAARFGIDEPALIARIDRLLDRGILTRFGPLFQIERLGGAFCLAAMSVAEERFDAVAEQVNALPQIAHNYRREHALNMWFVIAADDPARVAATAQHIEEATGLPVLLFPKEREYFVDMRLTA